MEKKKPSRLEVMLMLFAELRDRIKADNPESEELEMLSQLDTLIECYNMLCEQTSASSIEECFEPLMPLVEEAIEKLRSELDYHNLTDKYRELEQIEKYLLEMKDREANKASNLKTIIEHSSVSVASMKSQVTHLGNSIGCNLLQAYLLTTTDSIQLATEIVDYFVNQAKIKIKYRRILLIKIVIIILEKRC